jgi:hypothetical protein
MGRLGWATCLKLEGDGAAAAPARAPATVGGGPDSALLQELRAAQWNVSLAARRLVVARVTLDRRMKRAGIWPPINAMVRTTERPFKPSSLCDGSPLLWS